MRAYFGEERAEDFAAHHKIVMDLSRSHGWETAVDYDIQQRELVASNPLHDLRSLDISALTLITTRPSSSSNSAPQTFPSASKRPNPSQQEHSSSPRKKQKPFCFRCGAAGHFPADCEAETTSAGKPTARVTSTPKSKHALLASNGKQYCFNWSRASSCSYGSACTNLHECSLCGEPNHGAASCKSHN